MHHAKDGLYFERQVDGSVKVTLKRTQPGQHCGGAYWCEGDFEVVLDPLTWASAVAAVSLRGNIVEVIEAALGLHEQPQGLVAIRPEHRVVVEGSKAS